MVKQVNEFYETPTAEVVEVRSEGVICESGGVGAPGNYEPGGNPFGN